MTILIVSASKVDNPDHFLETWFSLLQTQINLSHYTTLMSIAWWDEHRRILQTPTNWISKRKNRDLSFEKQAFFIFTTWKDFERIKWDTQKQQRVQSRALACTSAYANFIKRATERFFILKFRKLTQYFCMRSNFWTIKIVSILVKVCIYMLYTRQCQGHYLMGAWSPQAPTIYLWETKILIKEPEWGHKNRDSLADFR